MILATNTKHCIANSYLTYLLFAVTVATSKPSIPYYISLSESSRGAASNSISSTCEPAPFDALTISTPWHYIFNALSLTFNAPSSTSEHFICLTTFLLYSANSVPSGHPPSSSPFSIFNYFVSHRPSSPRSSLCTYKA